jgi:osmotically-inducible protein OsmY
MLEGTRSPARFAGWLLLGAFCSGCPQLLIAQGVKTAASIMADDRSVAQQTADVELKSQIEQALLAGSATVAGSVNVDVFIGRVMLTGIVGDTDQRRIAARTARSIAGEHDVYDDIEIGSGGTLKSAAEDVAVDRLQFVTRLTRYGTSWALS